MGSTAESARGTGPAAPAETLAPVISLAARWASRAESGDSPAGAESAPEAAPIDAPAEATRPRLRALNTHPAPVAAAAEAPPTESASPAVSGRPEAEAETARPLRAAVIAAETPVTGLAPVSRFPALGAVPEEPALPAFVEYDDPEPEEEEPEPVDPEWALDQLVRRLARRGLSRAEVLTAARDLGLDEEQVEQARERLDDLGYLDDTVLAEEIKHSLYDRKGKSRTVVAREMAQRKIPQEVITEVLSSVEDDDELAAATELAIKRIGQLSSYDDATVDRRLSGFLSRRGYNGQIVRGAIKAAMSSRGSRVRFR
ncbi:regulatory protein RecX [Mycetocola spongiae]|uniref:regulatory protein RecX n=1 Tax=Mycetocola spongiae TaxID=2859226 RepID=UPI001CF42C61|nr:regulatory protein RecX [Mycetocola spongiae]UCR89999.1 RecX family transcriptional regulator [Mycetocola spongiae]